MAKVAPPRRFCHAIIGWEQWSASNVDGVGCRSIAYRGAQMTDVLETFESKGVCPMDCPDTCSWVVTVRDGKTVKLVGNREHPVTRGALCVKVGKYLEYTASPERIRSEEHTSELQSRQYLVCRL